ncbi:MAG: divergent polysaccharide deacetylase family protein [Candidatus Coatesbacteria bacterium]|nr:divergent polysaccharide deacetylase family protein [Candidatus Coatesbacteria bacterium]
MDFLQTRYGSSSVTVEMFSWAQDMGLFSDKNRQKKSEAIRKAVNEALIESGVLRNDMIFQKDISKGAPDEHEYREFNVSEKVELEALQALLADKAAREGASVVAVKKNETPDKRVLAIDLGYGRTKRQCLLLIQKIEKEKLPPPSSPQPTPIELSSAASIAQLKPTETATVAIIVDDCGYDLSLARRLVDLKCPMTFSVLPKTANASKTAELANENGYEVMIHLPLEPIIRRDPYIPELEIKCDQDDAEIKSLLAQAIESVPHAKGVNNHEGSKACADRRTMGVIMKRLRDAGLFFIDSRTTPDTVAFSTAESIGLKVANRDIFIDNENDVDSIKEQIDKLVELSIKIRQPAIGICHLRPKTVSALEEELPILMKEGHKFLLASQVVE